jgi:SpoVK/Ycf46/Vps4 family AAA+-type ATPase
MAAAAVLCTVRDEVPVVCAPEVAGGRLAGQPGLKLPLVIVAAPGQEVDLGQRTLIRVATGPASVSMRAQMWDALLPGNAATAHELAAVHRAGPLQAGRALADATAVASALRQPRLDQTLIARQLRQRALVTLPAAARMVEPAATWADLVLAEEQCAILLSAAARARNQATVLQDWAMGLGRPGTAGVRLLFAGPPGTGKTMAAELLAAELGLDLLVVDLAAMVSRWLGETEKNLAAVFDAAERCQAVLFFDEAESLFARRTAVSDSHDRWANLETAYLLGRMERFDGVTVLATNLRANIDEAFIRRLEYIIDFTDPTPAERERLWQGHLPATVPLDAGVRLDELAELYPLTGGIIRNAAMAAAFLAAGDGGRITQQHLVTAVRREYEKSGRSFPGIPRRLNGRG